MKSISSPVSVNVKRNILGSLVGFVAVNAIAGGYYGLAGAKNIPVEWLQGSPFKDYFIPGLFLLGVIGGLNLVATITVFANVSAARIIVYISAIIMLLWIIVQVAIIGFVSWMQPATVIIAIAILFLNHKLYSSLH